MLALLFAMKGNLPTFTLWPEVARLRFRHADAADAGLCVRRVGNAVLIDRRERLARDVRHRDHAFGRRDVRELRRSRDDIADRVNVRLAGQLIRADFDESAIELDARAFEAEIIGQRACGRQRPAESRRRNFPACC